MRDAKQDGASVPIPYFSFSISHKEYFTGSAESKGSAETC
jgi:hypothetical protein